MPCMGEKAGALEALWNAGLGEPEAQQAFPRQCGLTHHPAATDDDSEIKVGNGGGQYT